MASLIEANEGKQLEFNQLRNVTFSNIPEGHYRTDNFSLMEEALKISKYQDWPKALQTNKEEEVKQFEQLEVDTIVLIYNKSNIKGIEINIPTLIDVTDITKGRNIW